MSDDKFERDILKKIVTSYELSFSANILNSMELYESGDAVMWDGYIPALVDLIDLLDTAFRLNSNIQPVDMSSVFDDGKIETLSLAQIGYVFRDMLVHQKHHQGLFAKAMMDGKIRRLINRLKSILQE